MKKHASSLLPLPPETFNFICGSPQLRPGKSALLPPKCEIPLVTWQACARYVSYSRYRNLIPIRLRVLFASDKCSKKSSAHVSRTYVTVNRSVHWKEQIFSEWNYIRALWIFLHRSNVSHSRRELLGFEKSQGTTDVVGDRHHPCRGGLVISN